MTNERSRPNDNQYLFKASWNGTALKFWIDAPDIFKAHKRAERYVMKMEGGLTCIELEHLRTIIT